MCVYIYVSIICQIMIYDHDTHINHTSKTSYSMYFHRFFSDVVREGYRHILKLLIKQNNTTMCHTLWVLAEPNWRQSTGKCLPAA